MEKVAVSYREKEARVAYDVDDTSVAELIQAVEKAGYRASERQGE